MNHTPIARFHKQKPVTGELPGADYLTLFNRPQ
jgi:hypothetical protein